MHHKKYLLGVFCDLTSDSNCYPKGPKAPAGDWARTGSGTALVLAPRPAGHTIPARPFQPPSLRRRRKRKLKAKPRESHEDGRTSHPPRASETQRKRTHPPTPVGIEPARPIRLAPVAAITAALASAITAALGAIPPPDEAGPLAVCARPASPANVAVEARAAHASPARVEITARSGLVAAAPLAALAALATLAGGGAPGFFPGAPPGHREKAHGPRTRRGP